MARLHHRLARALVLLILITVAILALDWWRTLPADAVAEYVGRDACIDCHAVEDALWAGSDHDRAMAIATDETVLADFNDAEHEHFGVRSRMFRRDGKFLVHTDGPDGRMRDYEVKYVFGVRPLQQYLVEFPDGRVQCLPLAWDTERKRWFHLYPNEAIPHNDFLHWTGPFQNWNYMCAHCHSTNLQKNFDLATNRYHTTFSEINVSCETCHGPGSLHCRLAESRSPFWDRRIGFGLPNLKDKDSRVEIDTCAPCHAHQRIIHAGFLPGDNYLDYHVPSLLDEELYYPDGQILEEVYEYGSFVQSRMYRENVRCSDCHDPHSCTVKFKEEDKSRDKKSEANRIKDNRLCGQCHTPAVYDTPSHHFHPDSSKPGTLCVECHMAESTYMVVDPRRDHSMRIPRPELTVSLGIPNACNAKGCHDDGSKGETPEWALEHVEEWYGSKKREPRHFAHAVAAGRAYKPEGEKLLVEVARRREPSGMVRASVLLLLGRYLSHRGCDAWAMIREGLEDSDPLVRLASARALDPIAEARARGQMPAEEADALLLDERLLRLLGDPIRAVRFETIRVVAAVPREAVPAKHRAAFDTALDEYIKSQSVVSDQPASYTAIADIHKNQGRPDEAEKEYQKALQLDPNFVPARSHLALIHYERGDKQKAEDEYRRILESESHRISQFAPSLPGIHYSLGLLLAEDESRWDEAAEFLAKAVDATPSNPRIRRNLGWLYYQMGKPELAEPQLVEAHRLAPTWAEALHTLGFFYWRQGELPKALQCAERLVQLLPDDEGAKQFLMQIRAQIDAQPSHSPP